MGGSQEKIAEFCGAVMGDGWIQSNEKSFFIAGDPTEDKDYYDGYLLKLLGDILKTQIKNKSFPYWGVYGISIHSKENIKKLLGFGLMKGKKVNSAYVPEWISSSNKRKIELSFVRGLFDTDGSIFCQKDYTKYANEFNSKYHSKIRIRISSVSSLLIEQVFEICKKYGFRCRKRLLKRNMLQNKRNNSDVYILEINEINSIHKWFKLLKPSNPKHITKYVVWDKFGFCPPNTTIEQRKNMLKNQLNPYNLYKQE